LYYFHPAAVWLVVISIQHNIPEAMKERLRLIHSIPFSAILTTNFDRFLPGVPAASNKSKALMRKILRGSPLALSEQIMREIMMAESVKESLGTDLFGFEDDEEEEGSGVGISKTFEFGGIMKAEWGCKVTFEKSGKGVSKKVQCGGKYDGGSGKKEMADGTSFLDYFN